MAVGWGGDGQNVSHLGGHPRGEKPWISIEQLPLTSLPTQALSFKVSECDSIPLNILNGLESMISVHLILVRLCTIRYKNAHLSILKSAIRSSACIFKETRSATWNCTNCRAMPKVIWREQPIFTLLHTSKHIQNGFYRHLPHLVLFSDIFLCTFSSGQRFMK